MTWSYCGISESLEVLGKLRGSSNHVEHVPLQETRSVQGQQCDIVKRSIDVDVWRRFGTKYSNRSFWPWELQWHFVFCLPETSPCSTNVNLHKVFETETVDESFRYAASASIAEMESHLKLRNTDHGTNGYSRAVKGHSASLLHHTFIP